MQLPPKPNHLLSCTEIAVMRSRKQAIIRVETPDISERALRDWLESRSNGDVKILEVSFGLTTEGSLNA